MIQDQVSYIAKTTLTPLTSSEFAEIMQCFTLLIKRLGPRIWVGEGPEYPQVIFDSIKDNPSFIDRIQESGGDKRHILWFREYLSLIRDASIHSQVCLKMLSFLCEELQHARFGDSRAAIMAFAAFVSPSRKLSSCSLIPPSATQIGG